MALTLSLTPGVSWAESDTEPTPTASVLKVDALETALTGDDTSEKGSGEVTASPSNTPDSKPSASETSTTEPEDGKPNDATSDASDATQTPSTDTTVAAKAGITPFAAGPDGGTAPYVYWVVKDTDGNLVAGATFKFEYRSGSNWYSGNGANPLVDCYGVSECNNSANNNFSLDRDTDGGEFLLTRYGTSWNSNSDNRIAAGSNYRVSQVTAPAGYEWVVSGSNTKSIGNSTGNTASWNNGNGDQTHNFGTFTVKKNETQTVCTAGYIYGISETGQLQQIAPGGAVTNIGAPAPGVSSFNGLGIGSGGDPVYGYERTNSSQTVTMFSYDTTAGTWTNTQHTYNTTLASNGGFSGSLVAGAVNLATERYMFGGYQTTDNGWLANPRYTQVFKIWEYNPASGAFTYKGYVPTYSGQSEPGATNGDMAFDAAGTLFFVRGSGTSTTVFSVTAANINAANGGEITASGSQTFTTQNNVNGVAFDSTGKAFLGTGNTVWSYNMPNWSGGAVVAGTSSGYSGTDLASCSSPPTIVIEKEVIGGRVNATDQFKLTLHQGSTLLGEATTTGTATGVQDQRVGPLPTVRNVALNFAETGAGGANLDNYASAYQCTVTHTDGTVQNLQQVNGTSGSITIPNTGEAVRCVFRNSPLIASVAIHKEVTDALGNDPQPREGWTVGADATATTGTVVSNPSSSTQQTNESGNTAWVYTFGAYGDRANLAVSETMQPGYEFLSGTCVVMSLSGQQTVTELSGPEATLLQDVKPGDQVACTYANKPKAGTLAITKAFDSSVPESSGTDKVFTGTYGCTLGTPAATVASGTWTSTGTGEATLTPATGSPGVNAIPTGASCSATEDQPTGSDGLPNSSWEWDTYSVDGPVTIAANQTGNLTVTNKAKRVYGNFSITKVVPEGSTVADGMTFSGGWTCTLGTDTKTGTWGPIAPEATWTSTDSDEIPLGATCTATETGRAADPGVPGYEWDGDPEINPVGGVEATNETELKLITVTNKTKQILGSVTWVKVGEDEGSDPLSGSEWSLTGPGAGGDTIQITDCTTEPCTGPDMDPAAGKFKLEGLAWGEYTLIETKAPPGYVIGTTEHEFTIAGDNLTFDIGNITNHRPVPPTLPLTGGFGRDHVYLAGLTMLLLSMAAYGTYRIRGRRNPRGI